MSCPYPQCLVRTPIRQHNMALAYISTIFKKVMKMSDYNVERGTLTNISEELEDYIKLESNDLAIVLPKIDMKIEQLLS